MTAKLLARRHPIRDRVPRSIPGLVCWVDASRFTGLVDGATLPTFNEWSPSAVSFAPVDTPLYKTNIINGRPVMRFDGTDDQLIGAVVSTAQSGSLFVVMKTTALTTFQEFFTINDDPANNYVVFTIGHPSNSGALGIAQLQGGTGSDFPWTGVEATSAFFVGAFSSSGSAYEIRMNGTAQSFTFIAGSDTGDWFGDTTAPDRTCIGAIRSGGSTNAPFAGDIAELILYDGVLSSAQKLRVERYLGAKYGITVA